MLNVWIISRSSFLIVRSTLPVIGRARGVSGRLGSCTEGTRIIFFELSLYFVNCGATTKTSWPSLARWRRYVSTTTAVPVGVGRYVSVKKAIRKVPLFYFSIVFACSRVGVTVTFIVRGVPRTRPAGRASLLFYRSRERTECHLENSEPSMSCDSSRFARTVTGLSLRCTHRELPAPDVRTDVEACPVPLREVLTAFEQR